MEPSRMSHHLTIDEFRPALEPYEDMYRDIHQHPELGTFEKRTAALAAAHLRTAGYTVTTSIGGHGVVGVLANGAGPTVLLRADMDALPIRETTGLAYASTATAVDADGETKPLMHACGHDTHVTCGLAAATLLAGAAERWSGTLLVLFQPDEEHGRGARAMLDDGLYDKVPRPDVVLGQHLAPSKAGTVMVRGGVFMASADTLRVTVFGRGAHGAQPQDAIDPVVLAAAIVLRLQTVVAREIGPQDVASVTCASIHGGKAHNVIPDEVELLVNVRAFDETVREKVIAAVKRIIKGEALASGVEKEPVVEPILTYPVTFNDEATAKKLEEAFVSYFGRDRVKEAIKQTVSEDFSLLATEIGVPSVFWNFGGVDAELWARSRREKNPKLIRGAHQADYAPVIQPTLKTGIDAMSLAALTFLSGSSAKG